MFEGGAIMLYLVQKYDVNHKISYPFDTDKYWEMVQWLVWMQSGIGPMQVRRISPSVPFPFASPALPHPAPSYPLSFPTRPART